MVPRKQFSVLCAQLNFDSYYLSSHELLLSDQSCNTGGAASELKNSQVVNTTGDTGEHSEEEIEEEIEFERSDLSEIGDIPEEIETEEEELDKEIPEHIENAETIL